MDDFVLNVRQLAQFPQTIPNDPTDRLLFQRGLGGPYLTTSPDGLILRYLEPLQDDITALVQADAALSATVADLDTTLEEVNESLSAALSTLRTDTCQALEQLADTSVRSFNGRVGAVQLTMQDAVGAGMLTAFSPQLFGEPTAPTIADVDARNCQIANALFVQEVTDAKLRGLVSTHPFVFNFNGRFGCVSLTLDDIVRAGGAPVYSPQLLGQPLAVTPGASDRSHRIATTAFVHDAVCDLVDGAMELFGSRLALQLDNEVQWSLFETNNALQAQFGLLDENFQAQFDALLRQLTERIPLYTGPEPPAHAKQGDLWFDTSNNTMMVYEGGGTWVNALPTGDFLPLAGGTMHGNIAFEGLWYGGAFFALFQWGQTPATDGYRTGRYGMRFVSSRRIKVSGLLMWMHAPGSWRLWVHREGQHQNTGFMLEGFRSGNAGWVNQGWSSGERWIEPNVPYIVSTDDHTSSVQSQPSYVSRSFPVTTGPFKIDAGGPVTQQGQITNHNEAYVFDIEGWEEGEDRFIGVIPFGSTTDKDPDSYLKFYSWGTTELYSEWYTCVIGGDDGLYLGAHSGGGVQAEGDMIFMETPAEGWVTMQTKGLMLKKYDDWGIDIFFRRWEADRWSIGTGVSGAAWDLEFRRYTGNWGYYQDTPLKISNATGAVTIPNWLTLEPKEYFGSGISFAPHPGAEDWGQIANSGSTFQINYESSTIYMDFSRIRMEVYYWDNAGFYMNADPGGGSEIRMGAEDIVLSCSDLLLDDSNSVTITSKELRLNLWNQWEQETTRLMTITGDGFEAPQFIQFSISGEYGGIYFDAPTGEFEASADSMTLLAKDITLALAYPFSEAGWITFTGGKCRLVNDYGPGPLNSVAHELLLGRTYGGGAKLRVINTDDWRYSNFGGCKLEFQTTPNGMNQQPVTRMSIDQDGMVEIPKLQLPRVTGNPSGPAPGQLALVTVGSGLELRAYNGTEWRGVALNLIS